MTDQKSPSIISDLPIKSREEDIFSFAPSAKELVEHIFEEQQPESLVVGLSGAWGSGKTSFLNLIEKELIDFKTNYKSVITLRYVPWRVKNRDTLLSSFLPMLIDKINEEASKDPSLSDTVKKSLKRVRKYAKVLKFVETGLQPLAKVVPKGDSNSIELVSAIFKAIRTVFEPSTIPDIEQLHQEAYETLEKLQIPVLVMIDDVDRLEPTEIVDLLRLVRATAQLPYITFIMSFDLVHVIKAVNNVLNVDGQQFLEKFMQLLVTVPLIAQKSLNTILEDLLKEQVKKTDKYRSLNQDKEYNFDPVIDKIVAAEAIETPRDVYRISNTSGLKLKTDFRKFGLTSEIYLSVLATKFPLIYYPLIKFIEKEKIRISKSSTSQAKKFSIEEKLSSTEVNKEQYDGIKILVDNIIIETFGETNQ